MPLGNTSTEYGSLHKGLHWTMALLIIAQFIIAWMFINIPKQNPLHSSLFQWHVVLGLTVLILVLFRIFWRAKNPEILPAAILNYIERLAAQSVHLFLYIAMVLMPVSGYLMVTAKGHAVTAFGLVIPTLITSPPLASIAKIGHIYLSYFLLGVIVLHTIGALIHKDRVVLKRML
jgi:cytochrome b561